LAIKPWPACAIARSLACAVSFLVASLCRIVASASRTRALASSSAALSCSGSISAITWPTSTGSFQLTLTLVTLPETSAPTSTVLRPFTVPVALTTRSIVARSTFLSS
jgi:hypothetical protein